MVAKMYNSDDEYDDEYYDDFYEPQELSSLDVSDNFHDLKRELHTTPGFIDALGSGDLYHFVDRVQSNKIYPINEDASGYFRSEYSNELDKTYRIMCRYFSEVYKSRPPTRIEWIRFCYKFTPRYLR